LSRAAPAAWAHYDALTGGAARVDHARAWQELVSTLLAGAGATDPAPLAAWLWDENARHNLWRRPIPGMIELARELGRRGARVGVLSNSEGGLAELLAEIGVADAFEVIVDSGRLGFEKPDRRIFDHALAALGGASSDTAPPIHIGDSWTADIAGARAAGWRAIWYGRLATRVDDPEVAIAHDPAAARSALERWGVLASSP